VGIEVPLSTKKKVLSRITQSGIILLQDGNVYVMRGGRRKMVNWLADIGEENRGLLDNLIRTDISSGTQNCCFSWTFLSLNAIKSKL
jgi:hypothetical protein